jgi:hypothetical protein
MPVKKSEKKILNELRFALLVLGAQVLVTALAAAGCADCIACVTVHAYFHVKEPCLGFGELDHY